MFLLKEWIADKWGTSDYNIKFIVDIVTDFNDICIIIKAEWTNKKYFRSVLWMQ